MKKEKRYRYYTSQAAILGIGNKPQVARFPAQELERLVTAQIQGLLASPGKCTACLEDSPEKELMAGRALELAKRWPKLEISTQYEFVRKVLRRVVVGQSAIQIKVETTRLAKALLQGKSEYVGAIGNRRPDPIKLTADFQPHRRGRELHLASPDGTGPVGASVPSLVKAIARARDWYERIIRGEFSGSEAIAERTGLDERYVRRILRCAFLSPDIVDAILAGQQPTSLTLKDLMSDLPSDGAVQRQRLGFPAN